MLNFLIFIALLLGGTDSSEIENYLRAQLIDYANFEYRVINAQMLEGKDFEIDFNRDFKLKNRYGYIPVIIKNGKYEERTFIRVNLKLYKKALVANRRIKRGEKISREDFRMQICDVTNLRGEVISDLTQIKDSRMRLNVREGEIITAGMIEKTDDVYAGEKVTALFTNGAVAVAFPAIARSGGKRGETIRIQRKDGIVFKAKVINKNQVTILE